LLAKPGSAFDSDDHLFEIKWDGIRTLAFVENKQCRLLNRRPMDKGRITEYIQQQGGRFHLGRST